MSTEEIKELRTKILKGIELSYNRLLSSKQKEDGELVVFENGKIIKIKERDLKETSKFNS